MNYLKENLYKIIIIVFLFILPIVSFAVDVNGDLSGSGTAEIVNPIKSTTIVGLIKTILEGIIKIGMPIIVLAIIYCGFLFVKAQGKPEEIKKAKDALLYTLIGAAILLGSWGIAQLITDTVKAL